MRLRNVGFLKVAIEDTLNDPFGLPLFLLLLGEAGFGDGAACVAAFLQPHSPMLGRAAAESTLGTPPEVVLNGRETEGPDVRHQVRIRLVDAILFRLAVVSVHKARAVRGLSW
jgi:hypothetical protein